MDKSINIKPVSFLTIFIASVLTANYVTTGSIIFIIPFLLIGSFVWLRFSLKYRLSAILIIICINESFFKLLRTQIYAGQIGERLIEDIALFLMISLILPQISVLLSTINKRYEWYSKYIILYWIIIVISLIAGSYFIFGQPVISGIIPARKYLFIISYFCLAAIGFSLNDFSKFMQTISIAGTVLASMILIDIHLLGGGVIFEFIPDKTQIRADSLRFSVSTFLISVACIYNFICAKNSLALKKKLIYNGLSFICLAEIIFCNMTRARIIALIFVLILISIKKIDLKKVAGLIVLFVCISFSSSLINLLPASRTLGGLYNLTRSEMSTGSYYHGKGNINIRFEAFSYYTKLWLTKSPLFGVGVFSETRFKWNPMTNAELKYGYHISDINTMDTLVRFGVFGAVVLVALYLKLFVNIKHLWQKCSGQEHIILSTIFYTLIFSLLTPTLGNILTTNNLIYYGMFFYYLTLLNKKYPEQTKQTTI